eukprot:559072-Rhodomonas_salina.3
MSAKVCKGLNEFHKRLPGLPPQTVTVVGERASRELQDVSNRYYRSRRKEVLRTIESLGQDSFDGSQDQLSPIGLSYGSNASPSLASNASPPPLQRPIRHQAMTQNYVQPAAGRPSGPITWHSCSVSPNSSSSRLSRHGTEKGGGTFAAGAGLVGTYDATRPKTAGSFGKGAAYPTPPNTAPTTVGRFSRPQSTVSAGFAATNRGSVATAPATPAFGLGGGQRRARTLTSRNGALVPTATSKRVDSGSSNQRAGAVASPRTGLVKYSNLELVSDNYHHGLRLTRTPTVTEAATEARAELAQAQPEALRLFPASESTSETAPGRACYGARTVSLSLPVEQKPGLIDTKRVAQIVA